MPRENFNGFTPDTYLFLTELAFNNNKTFYEANKERYKTSVLLPMRALAMDLMPAALEIDPAFNTRLISVVSRIYRDARRLRGRPPYRDHAWLSFKRPGVSVSESFSMYFEIDTHGYGYGMGMYAPEREMMEDYRARVLSNPARFSNLASKLGSYSVEGETYKREHFPDAPEAVRPYINRRGISWCYYSEKLSATMDADGLYNEIEGAFGEMAGMYRFIMDNK